MIDNIGTATVQRPHKKAPQQPLTYQEKVELMAREKLEKERRDLQLRESLEQDRTPIPENRRPLQRKFSESQYAGFVIGDQRDESKVHMDKRDLQHRYKEQLEADLIYKSKKERERDAMEDGNSPGAKRDELIRRRNEKLTEESDFKGLFIGKDPKEVEEEKKMNAMKLRELSMADRGGKVEIKTLRELHDERSMQAPKGMFIGADESNLRNEKKEIAKKYYEMLASDLSVSPSKDHPRDKGMLDDYTAEGEFIERTGMTGFQIGKDESQTQVLHMQKMAKQTAYRQELLAQQKIATDILREREAQDKVVSPVKSLPYMRV